MDTTMSVRTYAKINLTLDVTGKRPDNYHNIDSIFEEVSLYDTVSVTVNDSGIISVSCSDPGIPCDESNIVWKAASVFFNISDIINPGIHIHIDKNIPSQAGMGGGSTNAAGVFRILNKMFNAGLSDDELMKAALPVGADTPFFIKGGLAHITGIGELKKSLPALSKHYIVCAKGNEGVSTPQAYREIDCLASVKHQNTELILEAVNNDDIISLMENALNTFELTDLPEDIEKIKSVMNKHNAVKSMMTGSGAAVFGIFTEKENAEKANAELRISFPFSGVFTNETAREILI